MARPIPVGTNHRALVDRQVTALSLFIKERCPQAELEISLTRYEEEEAHILVFPPDTLAEADREKLDAELAERSLDILLETGLLILAGVYERDQRISHRAA